VLDLFSTRTLRNRRLPEDAFYASPRCTRLPSDEVGGGSCGRSFPLPLELSLRRAQRSLAEHTSRPESTAGRGDILRCPSLTIGNYFSLTTYADALGPRSACCPRAFGEFSDLAGTCCSADARGAARASPGRRAAARSARARAGTCGGVRVGRGAPPSFSRARGDGSAPWEKGGAVIFFTGSETMVRSSSLECTDGAHVEFAQHWQKGVREYVS